MYDGIQIYYILPDGCLNGVFANESTQKAIFNEISRKNPNSETDKDALVGIYDCMYFDVNDQKINCQLKISLGNKSDYILEWIDNGNTIFTGIGWKAKTDLLMILYKSKD